jgi:hypothetical protein
MGLTTGRRWFEGQRQRLRRRQLFGRLPFAALCSLLTPLFAMYSDVPFQLQTSSAERSTPPVSLTDHIHGCTIKHYRIKIFHDPTCIVFKSWDDDQL